MRLEVEVALRKLRERAVERVWGRRTLPAQFAHLPGGGAEPIGEIWFEDEAADADLLVKYLFTSDRLSIQVHPDDAAARARGHARGKDEAWLVLEAEPGAVIGLGLTRAVTREELRAAALDGGIEALVDWRPVKAGDIFYSPAGTVHAIGGGLSLVEIQQNLDLTYRLHDYGRPRALHLDEGVAVARPAPYDHDSAPAAIAPGRSVAAGGAAFTVERWRGRQTGRLRSAADAPLLLIPLAGGATLAGEALAAGTVWSLDGGAELAAGADWDALVAYPGGPAAGPALG